MLAVHTENGVVEIRRCRPRARQTGYDPVRASQ